MDTVFRVLASDGVLEEVAAEARFVLRHPRLSGLLLRKALFTSHSKQDSKPILDGRQGAA